MGIAILAGLAGLAAAVVGVVAAWHLGLLVVTLLAPRLVRKRSTVAPIVGLRNFRVVDDRVWRGGRPSATDYRTLAERGVRTVIDLREEPSAPAEELKALGITVEHVPIVDGTLPTADQITRALTAIENSAGIVYVHCAAGVGRTGTIVASHLLAGGATRWQAILHNLSVGPPSLEQIAFVFTAPRRPRSLLVAVSRGLDAPRVYLGRVRQALVQLMRRPTVLDRAALIERRSPAVPQPPTPPRPPGGPGRRPAR